MAEGSNRRATKNATLPHVRAGLVSYFLSRNGRRVINVVDNERRPMTDPTCIPARPSSGHRRMFPEDQKKVDDMESRPLYSVRVLHGTLGRVQNPPTFLIRIAGLYIDGDPHRGLNFRFPDPSPGTLGCCQRPPQACPHNSAYIPPLDISAKILTTTAREDPFGASEKPTGSVERKPRGETLKKSEAPQP